MLDTASIKIYIFKMRGISIDLAESSIISHTKTFSPYSVARKGMKFSDEHCKNIGKSKIGNKNWLGKNRSESTKRKISNALMGNQNARKLSNKTLDTDL